METGQDLRCLRCGGALGKGDRYCSHCGLDLKCSEAAELKDLQAMERQILRLSEYRLIENSLLKQLKSTIEYRRKMLGKNVLFTPKAADEPAPPAAVPQGPDAIPDSSSVISQTQPQPPMPAPPTPIPVSKPAPAPIPIATASTPAQIQPALPEALEDRFKSAPISLGFSYDKPITKPSVEHAVPKVSPPQILHPPARQAFNPPPPPKPPRKPLSEILAAFMENRNIRWGEVVGGLLIIGCSIALIISLWDTLERIPYFQFLIFVSVTAALFGVGFYTLKRWKLESTSRGVLAIATLLVPLNFLAIAGLSKGTGGFLDFLIELVSIGIFTSLVGVAGRVLIPGVQWLLTLGLVGSSASQLLIVRFIHPGCTELRYSALGLLPVFLYCLSAGGVLLKTASYKPLTQKDGDALFSFIGMSSFALAVALGFLIYRYGELAKGLQNGAMLVALFGIPIATAGILVQQRLSCDPAAATLRTAATGIALLGMGLMLYAVTLAWPRPQLVVLACGINFVALTAAALALRVAIAHIPALASLIAGYLTGYHWITGNLSHAEGQTDVSLAGRMVSAESATALTGLFVLLVLAAFFIYGEARKTERTIYLTASEAVALGSLILVLVQGVAVPVHPAFVCGIYGIYTLFLNRRWRQPAASYFGLALLCISSVWILEWLSPQKLPLWASVLALESLLLGLILQLLTRSRPSHSGANEQAIFTDTVWQWPIARVVNLIAPLAFLIAFAAWAASSSPKWVFEHLTTAACLFSLYLLLTATERRPIQALLSGLMLIAVVIAGVGWVGTQCGTTDLQSWIAFAIALAGMALALFAMGMARARSDKGNTDSKDGGTAPMIKPGFLEILAEAWRHAAAVAIVLSFSLSFSAPTLGTFGLHSATAAALGVSALMLAWSYRSRPAAWVGSGLIFMSIAHGFFAGCPGVPGPRLILAAFLMHSTLALMAGLIAQRFAAATDIGERLRRILAQPVIASSVTSSFLVLPFFLLVLDRSRMAQISLFIFWLAFLWLTISCFKRWSILFALSQTASCIALLFAITAWLDRQPWVIGHRDGLMDPRSLQAYGIGLALFCLLLAAARMGLKSNPGAQALLNPNFHVPDRIVLAVVIGGYALLSFNGAVPSVLEELSIVTRAASIQQEILAWRTQVGGLGAWLLLGMLAVAVTLALREQWRRSRVLELLLLSLTAPMLIAARFNNDLAAGAALRWGLAAWLLIWSAALWLRGRAMRLFGAMDFKVDRNALSAAAIRNLVALVSASGILLITISATIIGFGSVAMPAAGSLFWHIGLLPGYVIPLGMLGLVMLGHALRDRSQGFVFMACQAMNFAITLAYALHVIQKGGPLNWIFVVQLATVVSGAWAVVWSLGGTWKFVQLPAPQSRSERAFLNSQLLLGVAGNGALLASALSFIVTLHPKSAVWIGDVGSPMGWTAWAMVAIAAALRIYPEKKFVSGNESGSIALAFIVLVACSFERYLPGSAYDALMLGWAVLALAIAAVANWLLRLGPSRSEAPTSADIRDSAARWVRITAGLAVLLGARAAWHGDHYVAASAIACASLAGAWVAILLQNKGWAFASGLGANAAVSLVVWHSHESLLVLLQANLIASAAIALLWLAARSRFSPKQRSEAAAITIDYLSVQAGMSLVGNACLMISAFSSVFLNPHGLPTFLREIGSTWGWLALLLSVGAGIWYLGQHRPQLISHLLSVSGLAFGVLAAASISMLDTGNWLSYHTLEIAWTAAACLALLAGRAARIPSIAPRIEILSQQTMRHWIQTIGFLTVTLAVRGALQDPGRPWWSAGVVFVIGLLLGALAVKCRIPGCVYASGLMANVIGIMIWIGFGINTTANLILANALCFTVAASIWFAVENVLRHRSEPINLRNEALPFAHAAVFCGLTLLAFQVCTFLLSSLYYPGVNLAGSLAWMALAAAFAPLVLSLWDPQARFAFKGMYAAGLMAAITALHSGRFSHQELCRTASLTVSLFVLLTAILSWHAPRLNRLGRLLRIPERQEGWPVEWFLMIQPLLASVPVGLSLWITLALEERGDRLAGPLSIALILGAIVFLTKRMIGGRRLRWQGSALFLGIVAIIEAGWAWLGPSYPSLLLHRTSIVLVALGIASAICYFAPAQDSTSGSSWLHAVRRQGRAMIVLTLVSLGLILFEEAFSYVPMIGVQLALPAIFGIALVMAAFAGAGIYCILVPERDPFALPASKRFLFVYFAEGMLALLFVHLWLTAPKFFIVQGFIKYWTLIIMAIAFLGAGLSRVFDRKGVKDLAEPIMRTGVFLPVLPVLGFWMHPTGSYTALWLLVGLFYAFLSITKRSYRFGLVAAISANNSLWFLLYQMGLGFLQHPQMWMAPISVAALITEYLNRERLTRTQSETVRYLALTAIYISSTADMFIAGLGNSLVLPLVLLLFSVLGVLSGILFRIRSYLFLGVVFLLLIIISMIWHAAVNLAQTWIWYASGIVLGAAILGLFALFEKRREEMLSIIEGLKQWD